jgi:hypothetical protein
VSIFVNKDTKVIVQGITGSQGSFYAKRNRDYGTQVVGGTSPKKAGTDVDGIPVFATVAEAKEKTGATVSMILVPAPGAAAAVREAAEAELELVICLTEGVPAQDEAAYFNEVKRNHPNVRLLGPNCPGLVTVGECNIGFIPAEVALHLVEEVRLVLRRDALGEADGELDAGLGRLEHGGGRAAGGDEDHAHGGARLLARFGDAGEDGDAVDVGAGLLRVHAADDLGAVVAVALGVEAALRTGDALDDDLR